MLERGKLAPDFTLVDVHGVERTLDQLLSGDPAILAFFKVSCPTCQLTLPFLERLFQQRVPVYGICQDDRRSATAFIERYGLTLPVLLDEARKGYPASNGFEITNVPSMFRIEKDHTITWASVGFIKRDLESLAHSLHVGLFHQDERVPDSKAG